MSDIAETTVCRWKDGKMAAFSIGGDKVSGGIASERTLAKTQSPNALRKMPLVGIVALRLFGNFRGGDPFNGKSQRPYATLPGRRPHEC